MTETSPSTPGRDGQIVSFYSFKGGTGRSMALANVAWILASAGKRVLVADWDLESPGLHRFFKPFLDPQLVLGSQGVIDMIRTFENAALDDAQPPGNWHEEIARVENYVLHLAWDFGQGTLDFLTAGLQNEHYSASLGAMDWTNFYAELNGAALFDALRANMKRQYDYVLVDSRTGLNDVASVCTLLLPDTLVDCFTYSDQGIDGAARVAAEVREKRPGGRSIRVLPVAMRVDQAEKEKADAGRALARRSFPRLPEGVSERQREAYWAGVEVPYQAFYNYEETLATFGDAPGIPSSLLSAYENITAAVSRGDVVSLRKIPENRRLEIKDRYRRLRIAPDVDVLLWYAGIDQVWAEWVQRILVAAGVAVVDPGPSESAEALHASRQDLQLLAIVSSATADVRGPEGLADRRQNVSRLGVYVADTATPDLDFTEAVHIVGLGAEDAATRVLALVGQSDNLAARQAWRVVRFPGEEPRWFHAPARNALFTGRSEGLTAIRDVLRGRRGRAASRVVVLEGMGGIGKSQLAQEYAHRFRGGYDLVWWIKAENPEFVAAEVADLADRLGLAGHADRARTAEDAVDALRSGEPTHRWLLVFDNAEQPEPLLQYLPGGQGDVLVTSRNEDWATYATKLDVPVFTRTESVAHLSRLAPSLAGEDRDRVADAVDDLPLAVEAAGAWLSTGTDVDDYLRELARSTATLSIDASRSMLATFDLSLRALRSSSSGAYRLLEICSVLAPEIALDLVHSDEMAEALLPYDDSVTVRAQRPSLVRRLVRLSLLSLDPKAAQVRMHRLLQTFVRERIAADDVEVLQHQAHLLLARARPSGEVDDPQLWDRFRQLWPHLLASEAKRCRDESVRALLIDRVRYLWQRGDWDQAERFGREVAAEWQEHLADETARAELGQTADRVKILHRQLLHLQFQLANVLRDRARFREAFDLDEAVLGRQRTLLGPRHAHTLMTAGSFAADMRALGRYRDALEPEKETHRAWSEEFGDDHRRTMAAANNLAVTYRALGDFERARALDEQVYRQRTEALGADHPHTLLSASCLARDRRELGTYQESKDLLEKVLARCRKALGNDDKATLTAQVNLATTLRALGRADAAAPLLDDAYRRLADRFGADTPAARLCRLNRAANLLFTQPPEESVKEMRATVDAYQEAQGRAHPLTLVAISNLSAALRADGKLDDARRLAEEAADQLEQVMGADHPHTSAARMNLAICLHDKQDVQGAAEVMRSALDTMARVLGPDHPDVLACRLNLTLIESDSGDGPAPGDQDLVDGLARILTEDHPTVRDLRAGRLIYRLIDPADPF